MDSIENLMDHLQVGKSIEQEIMKIIEEDMNDLLRMYKLIFENRDTVLYFTLKERELSKFYVNKIYEKIISEEFHLYFLFCLRKFYKTLENDLIYEIENLYQEYYFNFL